MNRAEPFPVIATSRHGPASRDNPAAHQVGGAERGRADRQRGAQDAGDRRLHPGGRPAAVRVPAAGAEEEAGAEAEEAAR